MKVVMLWEYYPACLDYFYRRIAGLADLPYAAQRQALLDQHYGWPDALSRTMQRHGLDVEFLIANAEPLQRRWLAERGATADDKVWKRRIALEQIRELRPDVLWASPYFDVSGEFFRAAMPYCGKAVAWVGVPPAGRIDASCFSVLLTSHPDMLGDFRRQFDTTVTATPGFDTDVCDKLPPGPPRREVLFCGQFSPDHSRRAALLARLLRRGIDVTIHGVVHGGEATAPGTLLRAARWRLLRRGDWRGARQAVKAALFPPPYERDIKVVRKAARPPVFGLDMYRLLARARLTLNVHLDAAGRRAGNMRMFEATGVGSCLVTERADNMAELFEPGREVLTYDGAEELVEVLRAALAAPEKTAAIARAGRERTRRCHTVERMWERIRPAFE